MPYITKKNITEFRSEYERKGFGHVDDISHTFGWASHEKFYDQMEWICSCIDAMTMSGLFDWLQNALVWVIQQAYSASAQLHYDKGVDMGRELVRKAEEIVNWAQKKINDSISAANNYIETNLINPINDRINNDIKPALKNAQDHVDNIMNQINGFDSKITAMGNSVDGFQSTLNDFQSRINNFNSTLDDAQKKLSQYKSLIDALDKRVTTLEGKPSVPFFDVKKFMEEL
jgi:uncharacterized protein YukE